MILFAVIRGGVTTGTVIGAAVALVIGGIAFALLPWRRRLREWPWDASSPTAGVLARENTSRNPGRTAVTSAALMIGVALIVFVAVFVNGFKESFLGAIDRSITSDMIIQGEQEFPDHPGAGRARRGQGRRAWRLRPALNSPTPKIGNGGIDTVNGVDPATFSNVYRFDWLNGGSDRLLRDLAPGQALMKEQFAKSHDLEHGQHVHGDEHRREQAAPDRRRRVQGPEPDDGPDHPLEDPRPPSRPGARTRRSCSCRFEPGPAGAQAQRSIRQALSVPGGKVQTNAQYKRTPRTS